VFHEWSIGYYMAVIGAATEGSADRLKLAHFVVMLSVWEARGDNRIPDRLLVLAKNLWIGSSNGRRSTHRVSEPLGPRKGGQTATLYVNIISDTFRRDQRVGENYLCPNRKHAVNVVDRRSRHAECGATPSCSRAVWRAS
jgi:hypothetical protein